MCRRREAIQTVTPLDLSVESAALGVLKVVDIKMAEAVRAWRPANAGIWSSRWSRLGVRVLTCPQNYASRMKRAWSARPAYLASGLPQADVKHNSSTGRKVCRKSMRI